MARIGSLLMYAFGMAALAEGMNHRLIHDGGKLPYRKSKLTSQQQRARNKAKAAKKARSRKRK